MTPPRPSKVEIDEYAQAVLKARISDNMLHRGPIHADIKVFTPQPSTLAEGLRGWIPLPGKLDAFQARFFQGISCGGRQEGMGDGRTSLLKYIFKIFDALPEQQRQGRLIGEAIEKDE